MELLLFVYQESRGVLWIYLKEPSGDREIVIFFCFILDAERSWRESCDQGAVVVEDREFSFRRATGEEDDLSFKDDAFERVCREPHGVFMCVLLR